MPAQVVGTSLVLFAVIFQVSAYLRVCYYTNWSQYRPGDGKYTPDKIDPSLCTHIIFAFGKLEGNKLVPFEWNDDNTEWSDGMYTKVNALKKKNPQLKTLLATGGWNAGSRPYSDMVATRTNRTEFVTSTIKFLRKRGFDGLDIDWEYPAKRGGRPEDKARLVLLLQELRAAFDQEARASGKDRLLLTAAVPAGKSNIDAGYDIPSLSRLLDFVNLMSYDFHGSWESKTGHNSPLYARRSETGNEATLNMDYAANYWVQSGAPREKLIIGIGLYGRSFQLTSPADSGMGAPSKGAGKAGKFSREAGFMAYYEVCSELQNGAKRIWDPEHRVPYMIRGDTWVGYDDAESIKEKIRWLKRGGYGGAMVWSLALDDFSGKFCKSGPYPLLRIINSELGNTPKDSFIDDSNLLSGISSVPSRRPVTTDQVAAKRSRPVAPSSRKIKVSSKRVQRPRPISVNPVSSRRSTPLAPLGPNTEVSSKRVRRPRPVSPVAFIKSIKTPPVRVPVDVTPLEAVASNDPVVNPIPRRLLLENNVQRTKAIQIESPNVPIFSEFGSGPEVITPNKAQEIAPNSNNLKVEANKIIAENTGPEVMPVIPMEVTNALMAASGGSMSDLFPLNIGSNMLPSSLSDIFSAPRNEKRIETANATGNMLPPPVVLPLDNPFNSVGSITGQDSNQLATELFQNANGFTSAISNDISQIISSDSAIGNDNMILDPNASSEQQTQSSKVDGFGLPELQRGPDGSFIVPSATIEEINNLISPTPTRMTPEGPRIISLFDRNVKPNTVQPPSPDHLRLSDPTPAPISVSQNELLGALDQRNTAIVQESRSIMNQESRTANTSTRNDKSISSQGRRVIDNIITQRRSNSVGTPFIRPVLPASLSRAIVTIPVAPGQRGIASQRNAIVINPRPLRPSGRVSSFSSVPNRLRVPENNMLLSNRLNTRASASNLQSQSPTRVVRPAGSRSPEVVASIIGTQTLTPSQAIALRMRLNRNIRIVPLRE